MKTFFWIVAIFAVLFVLLEVKNRKERPFFQKLEKLNADILEGCFVKDPVSRRRFLRGLAHFTNGRMDLAQTLFVTTARRAKAPEDEAICSYMASKTLAKTGNNDMALSYAKRAVELQPERKHIRIEYARMLARNRDEAALDEFEKLITEDPANPLLYHSYGNAYILLDSPENAIVAFERTLELDPDFNGTHGLMMLAYAMLGDRENAAKWYNAAVEHGENAEQLSSIMEDMLAKAE